MSSTTKPLRWGIIATGAIAQHFTKVRGCAAVESRRADICALPGLDP